MAHALESKLPPNLRALVKDVLTARSIVEKAEAKAEVTQASLSQAQVFLVLKH
jgi:hypothetical protein